MRASEVSYLYYGKKMWHRMAISAWSLRNHWTGDVTIYCRNPDDLARVSPLCKAFDLRGVLLPQVAPDSLPYNKMGITAHIDAEYAICLDLDTLVEGDLSPLIGHEFAITSHGDRTGLSKPCVLRAGFYHGLDDALDQHINEFATLPLPDINAGVFAFQYGCKQLTEVHRLFDMVITAGRKAPKSRYVSGVSLKYGLLPSPTDFTFSMASAYLEHTLFTDEFNCCSRHGLRWDDAVVRHYVGRSHGRSGPEFRNAIQHLIDNNIAGFAEHDDRYDIETRNLLTRMNRGDYDSCPDG